MKLQAQKEKMIVFRSFDHETEKTESHPMWELARYNGHIAGKIRQYTFTIQHRRLCSR